MKRNILRYLKHLFVTLFVLVIVGLIVLVNTGGSVHYGDHPLMRNLEREGPYVFYENDSILTLQYIRGNKEDGFYVEKQAFPADSSITASCYFPLDSSQFAIPIKANFDIPPVIYRDDNPILAISDIESGYKTFRDFLINNRVIDAQFNWTFGPGHLVLIGDFVDRGYSTTQVLWLIYQLEQKAKKQGGQVHYILGNHELKNFQGRYEAASTKYYGVAAILGKQPHQLYDSTSFLGRWMANKNTLESINGHLFAHGGVHPDLAEAHIGIEDINRINRAHYYHTYYPKPEKNQEQLVLSTRTGICWYRGYFKEDLQQEQIDEVLEHFGAKSITVGHTLQSSVNRKYNGKVIAIDVKHPKDYQQNWPHRASEGLLIDGDRFYRVLHDGQREEI